MRVWLIVVLALLGVVSRYGLQMRPAHALLALRWSGQATQRIYENHAADCVRMFVGFCWHDAAAPVAVSLAFDDPFLASSVERDRSLEKPWLLHGLDAVLNGLESPTEIRQARGLSPPYPISGYHGPKGGFCNSL